MPSFNRSLRIPSRSYTTIKETLKRTPLYDIHVQAGAKMVPFAGFSMPVQYDDLSVGESHKWTRQKASIFDVSHMVQFKLCGTGATDFLERITPGDMKALKPFSSTLSVLTNDRGGIIDDTVITKHTDEAYYLVTNAACRDKDLAHIRKQISESNHTVELQLLDDYGLIALQGPAAAEILQSYTPYDLRTIKFGQSAYLHVAGEKVHVARGGYTGEDGFEICIPSRSLADITQQLLRTDHDKVRFAGLGARDSLRLEAGMCLYGHDLDDTISPNEAGLLWVIGKRRRAEGGFLGDLEILRQIRDGVTRKRVGMVISGAPAREGAEILTEDASESLGKVTSGCPSPTLGKNIAMGFVTSGSHKAGTKVLVKVRGKAREAEIVKMPFVDTHYYK